MALGGSKHGQEGWENDGAGPAVHCLRACHQRRCAQRRLSLATSCNGMQRHAISAAAELGSGREPTCGACLRHATRPAVPQ